MCLVIDERDTAAKTMLAQRGRNLKTRVAGADDQNWSLRHASGHSHAQRQAVEPAKRVVEAPPWLAGQLERGDAFGQRAKHRFAFEPRHRLADAAMDAGAESHVSGGAALDVEEVRLVPAAWIAVGGGKKQQYLFAVAKLDATDLDRLGRGPEEGLHRRLETQHFLESEPDQRRIFLQDR